MYALCPKHRVSIRINFLGTNRCDRSSAHLFFSLVSASRGVINDLPHLYTIAHRPRNIRAGARSGKRRRREKKKEKGYTASGTPAADTDVFLVHNLRAVITRASRILYFL